MIYFSVYHFIGNEQIRADFDNISDAMRFAKEHDTIVVQRYKGLADDRWLRKIADIVAALGVIGVLSLISWGWLDALLRAGLIP